MREDVALPSGRQHAVQQLYPSPCSVGVSLFYNNSSISFFNLSEKSPFDIHFSGLYGTLGIFFFSFLFSFIFCQKQPSLCPKRRLLQPFMSLQLVDISPEAPQGIVT